MSLIIKGLYGIFICPNADVGDLSVYRVVDGRVESRERVGDLDKARRIANSEVNSLPVDYDGEPSAYIYYDARLVDQLTRPVEKEDVDDRLFKTFTVKDYNPFHVLRDTPLHLLIDGLRSLINSVGYMKATIEDDARRVTLSDVSADVRLAAEDDRIRRQLDVDRHIVEVITYLAPQIVTRFQEMIDPQTPESKG